MGSEAGRPAFSGRTSHEASFAERHRTAPRDVAIGLPDASVFPRVEPEAGREYRADRNRPLTSDAARGAAELVGEQTEWLSDRMNYFGASIGGIGSGT